LGYRLGLERGIGVGMGNSCRGERHWKPFQAKANSQLMLLKEIWKLEAKHDSWKFQLEAIGLSRILIVVKTNVAIV